MKAGVRDRSSRKARRDGSLLLRIEAASRDGAWESEPAQMACTDSKSLPKPDLFLLAAGINNTGQ
jgi:hypothetical protein